MLAARHLKQRRPSRGCENLMRNIYNKGTESPAPGVSKIDASFYNPEVVSCNPKGSLPDRQEVLKARRRNVTSWHST